MTRDGSGGEPDSTDPARPAGAGDSGDRARDGGALDERRDEAEYQLEHARPLTWRTVMKRLVPVAVAGAANYLVLPSITAVLGAWPRLSTLNLAWLAVALLSECAAFACTFALQRLALGGGSWFPVITSDLTGNAITNVMPGADLAGAAVQFRMLATAGISTDTAVSGMSAFSLLQVGGLLALPIFCLPAVLLGSPVRRGLVNSALVGAVGFVLFAGMSLLLLGTDRPLAMIGRGAESLWNKLRRPKVPLTGLDTRLLRDRDTVIKVLGANWRRAVLLCTGRLLFDFCCLLAALWATGSHPRPALVLLAYAAAGVIGLLPITPGGLGIVEATLSGMLVLAGVPAGDALLATLAYRIACYWLPVLAGAPSYLLFRRRYGTPGPAPSVPAG